MKIEWNKVTWYSKALSILFFITALPALTFHIGRKYQELIPPPPAAPTIAESKTETSDLNQMISLKAKTPSGASFTITISRCEYQLDSQAPTLCFGREATSGEFSKFKKVGGLTIYYPTSIASWGVSVDTKNSNWAMGLYHADADFGDKGPSHNDYEFAENLVMNLFSGANLNDLP